MAGACTATPSHVTRAGPDGAKQLTVETEDGWSAAVPPGSCHLANDRDDTLDDLVKSDYLHEPG